MQQRSFLSFFDQRRTTVVWLIGLGCSLSDFLLWLYTMCFYKSLAYKLKIQSRSKPTTLFDTQRNCSQNGMSFSPLLLNKNPTLYPTENPQILSKLHPSLNLEASPVSYSKDPHILMNVINQQNLKWLCLFYECTKGNVSSHYTSEEM